MFLWDKSFRLKGFGYYILGSFILTIFYFLGQIPLSASILWFPPDIPLEELQNLDLASQNKELLKNIPSNLRFFLTLFIFVATAPAIWLVVRKIHDLPMISILSSRKKIDFKRIFYSFVLWGAVGTAITLVSFYLSPENYEINFKLNEFLILAIIAILLIPIQTSVEEIVFRGYLMQGFGHLFNSRFIALFITSVGFGSLHLLNPEIEALGYASIILYISVGFLLGVMTLMDEGLELAIGFHAANNLFIVLLVTADWTVFQTESILIDISEPKLTLVSWLTPLIIYPILLSIFARKYSWTDWKGKLFSKIR